MPLHPDAKAYLEQRLALGVRPIESLSVAEARRQRRALAALEGEPEPIWRVDNLDVPGPAQPIPLRVYTPKRSLAPQRGVLVYFHGGGWVTGDLDTVDNYCCALANRSACIVVSANYRHAPEHKFPAAAEDAYAATRWVSENADAIGASPGPVAVGGTSAGGNLAAAVSLMARDRGLPNLAHQLLIVPVTDFSFNTVSYHDNAEGYGLTRDAMIWYWKQYLAAESNGSHPYASPLQAENFAGLPPAFVMTAEYDPLRDEGEAYATRLRTASVPVAHRRYKGMVHSFLGPSAIDDAARAVRLAFA